MTQSGAGFTTAALFARPLGASQPAKAVCLASKGVKVSSRMHAMGVKGFMVAARAPNVSKKLLQGAHSLEKLVRN